MSWQLLALFFVLLALSSPAQDSKAGLIVEGAKDQVHKTVIYDPAYYKIEYPGGDLPIERGVCCDVVVRAFRHAGADLQTLVHKDMKEAFRSYPQKWGLSQPDPNIDHRRVPNLMTFFKRKGKELAITQNGADYQPGDVVAWKLPNGLLHIGVVSDAQAGDRVHPRPLIIHNIGEGAKEEDVLFGFQIIGHYRYF